MMAASESKLQPINIVSDCRLNMDEISTAISMLIQLLNEYGWKTVLIWDMCISNLVVAVWNCMPRHTRSVIRFILVYLSVPKKHMASTWYGLVIMSAS